LIRGDSLSLPLADDSVDCIVTSPPYFGSRAYGEHEAEVGRPRQSLADYLRDLLAAFAECGRVLRTDGLLWVNIGDTASGSGGAGGDYNPGGRKEGRPKFKAGPSGLPPMQWCNIPARLSIGMQAQGWLLRSHVYWDKGRIRPEDLNHARRPGVSHEEIFMFAKHRSHRFYPERLEERGNVWHFPPNTRTNGNHAPFPPELPKRCILPSTEPGELVLDPFAGGDTTAKVAEELGRRGIGVDLYAGV
jgi:DNA modification methylase